MFDISVLIGLSRYCKNILTLILGPRITYRAIWYEPETWQDQKDKIHVEKETVWGNKWIYCGSKEGVWIAEEKTYGSNRGIEGVEKEVRRKWHHIDT